jgi:hypothetical protein
MENHEKQKFKERLERLLAAERDENFVGSYVDSLMKDDGKAHISVDLRRGNQVFETYSSHRDLASGIFSYVEGVAKYLKSSTEVAVDFIIAPEQVGLEDSIRKEFLGNYRFDYDEKRAEVTKIKWQSLILMIIGIFFLLGCSALGYFATKQNDGFLNIMSQVVSIVSWVFIWAAVEKFYFDRTATNREALKAAQLADAAISFSVLPLTDESLSQGAKQ